MNLDRHDDVTVIDVEHEGHRFRFMQRGEYWEFFECSFTVLEEGNAESGPRPIEILDSLKRIAFGMGYNVDEVERLTQECLWAKGLTTYEQWLKNNPERPSYEGGPIQCTACHDTFILKKTTQVDAEGKAYCRHCEEPTS